MTATQATRTGDVLSWATDLDEKTMAQAHRTANLSFVHKPLALMPDAHLGIGATVGSVVATEGSIIPACLLYTSPSPRDQRGSRMPSSA